TYELKSVFQIFGEMFFARSDDFETQPEDNHFLLLKQNSLLAADKE
ncbi:5516_t:CDS:2, partial [Racocetra persica]